ncbi:Dephospho-CoA kinase cab5 [Thecaphora frezii]
MLVVGLTGGIASGKSTASRLISSHPSRIPLIDLDVLARQVVEPGQPTLSALVQEFGTDILQPDGTLNRPGLGRKVFGNAERTKALNRITHGAIRRRMAWMLVKFWIKGEKVVVVDTPLLIEAGMWKFCGCIVLVYCSEQDQLSRMLQRDSTLGLTPEDASNRLKSQLPLPSKIPYADVVLDNSASFDPSSSSTSEEEGPAWARSVTASPSLKRQVDTLITSWHRRYDSGTGRIWWLFQWLCPPLGFVSGLLTAWIRSRRTQRRLKEKAKL